MPLTSGTKLGPYEILSPIGAGGMGEVYRARDTRLGREVAVKVLPAHLSSDSSLKARFEREAKAISGLNHPKICTLHDVGSQTAPTTWSWNSSKANPSTIACKKARSHSIKS
jgi:eukaryotic-like serine/threonine-protein kinase